MSLYLRRLVSGDKTRFRDDTLDLELDLAYVTDRVIVMGFPAVGVESVYRNHRADVQRFLSARHGSDFWVFNLCPLAENAYHDSVFDGRVSRYPFPDHHVPPFSYLSLATREMHAWLSGSDDRVAVLHCKAGKGRSGTLACAYLLLRHALPSASIPSPLHDSFSEWSLIDHEEGLHTPVALPVASGATLSRVPSEPMVNVLKKVLDLHTAKRMKPSLHHSRRHSDASRPRKPKMGVSIPSQRRWLFYWSQVLDGKGPPSLRPFLGKGPPGDQTPLLDKKVKITKLAIRMGEPHRLQPHVVPGTSTVVTNTGKGNTPSESTTGLWVSLARYSDRLVDELEYWEKESQTPAGAIETSPFGDSRWDKAKMIHSFAQMYISDVQPSLESDNRRPVLTFVLRPQNGVEQGQVELRESVPRSNRKSPRRRTSTLESSYTFVSPPSDDDLEDSILLEENRELCIKLCLGEVVLGWVWLIPAFHISPDSPSSNLVLSREDVDFTIGIGKALVDIEISFSRHACTQGS